MYQSHPYNRPGCLDGSSGGDLKAGVQQYCLRFEPEALGAQAATFVLVELEREFQKMCADCVEQFGVSVCVEMRLPTLRVGGNDWSLGNAHRLLSTLVVNAQSTLMSHSEPIAARKVRMGCSPANADRRGG